MKINKIHNLDCLDGMKQLKANSIDLMVTDPPYGLSFMGKDWDKAVPSVEIWKECYRVLKDGAFAFIMSSPRLDVLSQMVMRLEKARFRIDFTPIYWAYASGFPKAGNIGKMVDKYKRRDYVKAAMDLGIKPKSSASWHDWTKGEHAPSNKYWEKFKKAIPKKDWERIEREVIGKKQKLNTYSDKGYSSGEGSYENTEVKITTPATPQAKALNGSYAGFQPKPAVEVIIVAMKPLSEKTYVEQALKNGKGVTWLDGCRVPLQGIENHRTEGKSGLGKEIYGKYENKPKPLTELPRYDLQGRFPANLLVSGDVLNDGKTRGVSGSAKLGKPHTGGHKTGFATQPQTNNISPNDSGSFSRYFSLDAWWQGLIKKLPKDVQKVFPFLIVPKASRGEKNKGLEDFEEKPVRGDYEDSSKLGLLEKIQNSPRPLGKCTHPTVKPLQLISYLITLGSKQGELILDPFMGSGTTAISARITTRKFIGFEISKEYHKIAIARLKPWMEQQKLG